ncbi:C40 family peptidase [Dokdonella sp.]|uniref:C40 family peptidase n=1 Tax=Dokdonella sp. TaxID=2291710 RepID=UPI0025C25D10|nr:C40 family peptidase [Dokdonella sp.]
MVDITLDNWEMNRLDTLAVPAPAISATPAPLAGTSVATPATSTHAAVEPKAPKAGGLRSLLADFAMTLRDIRYRRGGSEPSTGFDCSGFVRYVYKHALGKELPQNSASQYQTGTQIARNEMKTGDLVFFRIKGKRISHVGIYLGEGRFIHAPSTGKRISVSELNEGYWAKRFVGAKRPNVLS